MGKELWTEGDEGEPIALYAGFNEQDEARYITDRISEAIGQGLARSEIAILYRSNAQSRVLEEALLRAAIPYRIYGGQRFFERAEIKNAMAYMRLIANRGDDGALERIINVPTRGIGDKTLETLRQHARQQDVSLWQAGCDLLDNKGLPGRAANAVQTFMQLIEQLAERVEGVPLYSMAQQVIEHSGLLAFHEKEKGEKAQARVENLEELVSAARAFENDMADEEEEGDTLLAFLAHASL